jgi:chromosome segregation ATPase
VTKNLDVNDLGSEELDGADSNPDPKSPASNPNEDYKRRFDGANRTIGRLNKQAETLQKQIDEITDTYERQLTELRQGRTTVEKATADLQGQLKTVLNERDTFKSQVERYTARNTEQKLIGEKFPQLAELHLAGDLRSRTEFTGETADADFENYLTRMASRLTPQQTPAPLEPSPQSIDDTLRRYAGITPSAPAPVIPGSKGGKRTLDAVSLEMSALDPRNPKDRSRYEALVQEMDQLL